MPLTRRASITMSVGSFFSVCLALPSILRRSSRRLSEQAQGQVSWDTFLAMVADAAARAHTQRAWDEDRYVRNITGIVKRLDLSDHVIADAIGTYKADASKLIQSGVLELRREFEIALVGFEANQGIPHHDHPDMTRVQLCARGRVVVKNFDALPSRTLQPNRALLRPVSSELLTPGSTSSLTSRKGNVHTLHAHERSEVIELYTPPYDFNRTRQVRWFEIDPNAGVGDLEAIVVPRNPSLHPPPQPLGQCNRI